MCPLLPLPYVLYYPLWRNIMHLTINTGTLSKAHETDAGFDIHSNQDITIPPQDKASINTGLTLTFPRFTFGFVKPRSGSSFNSHIETGAGVIDNDYIGEIRVKLYNNGDEPFHITNGQRIAQLVLLEQPRIRVRALKDAVYNAPERSDKRRTDKGFGSTGQ